MNALERINARPPLGSFDPFSLGSGSWFDTFINHDSIVKNTSNLYETDSSYILQLAIPGIDSASTEISVNGSNVTVRASQKVLAPEDARTIWSMDSSTYQVVKLPLPVTGEGANASYMDGILTITLPKAEMSKTVKISVDK